MATPEYVAAAAGIAVALAATVAIWRTLADAGGPSGDSSPCARPRITRPGA